MELSNAQKGERGNTKYGVFHATVTPGKKVDVDHTTTKIIMTEYNKLAILLPLLTMRHGLLVVSQG